MKSITTLTAALCLLLPALCIAAGDSGHDDWWQRLQALCGNAYEGTLVRAPDGDDTFRNRRVVMHVRDCRADRVRVPLVIDDDRSRTWVFTRGVSGIELKHDHRHEDGTPDAVTRYGGTTSNAGSADTQMFPADDETRAAIPGSGLRSAWLVEIHPGERFTYAANRVGTGRGFQVDFDLAHPVAAPEAPGWSRDGTQATGRCTNTRIAAAIACIPRPRRRQQRMRVPSRRISGRCRFGSGRGHQRRQAGRSARAAAGPRA